MEDDPPPMEMERFANDPILDPCDDAVENAVLLQWVANLKALWTAPLPDSLIATEAARRFGVLDE
jgi:hypothetical protein